MKSEVHSSKRVRVAKKRIFAAVMIPLLTAAPPDKIAVLDFDPHNFPPSFSKSLTEKFRQSLTDSSDAVVFSRKSTGQFSVLYQTAEEDYKSCRTLSCALEIGKKLGADYLIAGTVSNFDSTVSLNMQVFSMDFGIRVDSIHIATAGGIDSLLILAKSSGKDLGKSLTKVIGKPVEPLQYPLLAPEMQTTMLMGPRVTAAANSRSLSQPIVIHGPVPGVGLVEYLITSGKLRAALYSSAIPGSGQLYSKKKWSALSFFTTELVISGMALYHHQSYKKAHEEADRFYALYENTDFPELAPGYKEQVLHHVETLKHHNNWLKNYRDAGRLIWLINIAHAYYVGPETIYSVRPKRTDVTVSYNPVTQKPALNVSITLD
ncbi:MAG: DUF5683 domain-containing protein [Candidatus Marinimicrobia bacterium]|jgi:TolB-like protein|nr:DUF5683 domain-containing protein [Candidatus Neomarinimicrobiota bacterium]MDP7072497.1 DUF5683 domain-containing protein [Candidatus Neomarinimicrobiota bacterium]